MFEGQQTVQATFRVPEGKRMKNIGVIEFRNGVFEFVGSPETYEGVRNLLAFHGVKPDYDPLADLAIIPVNLKTGEPQGDSGSGKVRPPADDYSDLDDLSDIKELKAKAAADGQADTATSAASDSRASQVRGERPVAETPGDLRHGSGADSDAGPAQRSDGGGDNQLRAETEVTDSAEDFDFS